MKIKLLFLITITFITIKTRSQDITSNLILDMAFSNEATDLTNNASPILSGFETYTTDRDGNSNCAVVFNGQNNEYIEIPANVSNSLVNGDEFTISLWFKMTNNDNGNRETFFLKNEVYEPNSFYLGVYDGNSPLAGDSKGEYLWDIDWMNQVDVAWDNADWHHLVLVRSNNETRLYRDNMLKNQVNNINFDIGSVIENYKIGKDLTAVVDDLKVYHRALNVNEVDALYNLTTNCQALNIEKEELSSIRVITISDKSIVLENLKNNVYKIEIYNTMGKSIKNISNVSTQNNLIDLSNYSTGVYFMKIRNNITSETQSIKFIIR